MKKVLFFLFAAIILMSCSNDSDDGKDYQKKYPVTFNVSAFSMESGPLKAATKAKLPAGHYGSYVIYDKSGDVVVSNALSPNDISVDGLTITEELPAGKHYICVMLAADMSKLQYDFQNYESDVCNGYFDQSLLSNEDLYYGKIEYIVSVNPDENKSEDIKLEPMWSKLEVIITDSDKCDIPEGSYVAMLVVDPLGSGFYLKNKKSCILYSHPYDYYKEGLGIAAFRNNATYNTIVGQSDDSQIYLEYKGEEGYTGRRIIYRGALEPGKKYTLKGTLGGGEGNGSPSFNVSVADFVEEDLPFLS